MRQVPSLMLTEGSSVVPGFLQELMLMNSKKYSKVFRIQE